jgi:hypothetical protein
MYCKYSLQYVPTTEVRNVVYAELDYKRLDSLQLLASEEHSVSFICYVLPM